MSTTLENKFSDESSFNNLQIALDIMQQYENIIEPAHDKSEKVSNKITFLHRCLARKYINANQYRNSWPHLKAWYKATNGSSAACNWYHI